MPGRVDCVVFQQRFSHFKMIIFLRNFLTVTYSNSNIMCIAHTTLYSHACTTLSPKCIPLHRQSHRVVTHTVELSPPIRPYHLRKLHLPLSVRVGVCVCAPTNSVTKIRITNITNTDVHTHTHTYKPKHQLQFTASPNEDTFNVEMLS